MTSLGLLDMLREMLTSEGYDVMAVTTGAAALAAVPKFLPHVLLVDISMPGVSGPRCWRHCAERAARFPYDRHVGSRQSSV